MAKGLMMPALSVSGPGRHELQVNFGNCPNCRFSGAAGYFHFQNYQECRPSFTVSSRAIDQHGRAGQPGQVGRVAQDLSPGQLNGKAKFIRLDRYRGFYARCRGCSSVSSGDRQGRTQAVLLDCISPPQWLHMSADVLVLPQAVCTICICAPGPGAAVCFSPHSARAFSTGSRSAPASVSRYS